MPHWLKGRSEEKIKKFTEKIFETILIQAIRPKMYEEIKMHREQNARLVILSAAFNYICQPVAQHLQMDDFICSRLEVVDGVFTGNSVGTLCFDGEKLKRIKSYCSEHNISLDDAYYYADSIADIPVLETVGNPHCINPDKNLRHVALQRKWHVHNW